MTIRWAVKSHKVTGVFISLHEAIEFAKGVNGTIHRQVIDENGFKRRGSAYEICGWCGEALRHCPNRILHEMKLTELNKFQVTK